MPIINSIKNYFITAYQEISKVVWPTRDVIIRYTILVVILSLIIAAFLGSLDFLFKGAVEWLIRIN